MRARAIAVAALVMVLAGVQSARAETLFDGALTKFCRGAVNAAIGLPSEVIHHVGYNATQPEDASAAGTISSALVGVAQGVGWGVLRMGSGLVDVFTFPVPFNDNRPLVEPDFAL